MRYRAQSNRKPHTFAEEKVSFKLPRNLLQKTFRGRGDSTSQLIIFCWVMDVFFVDAVFQSYSGLKLCSPLKKQVRNNLFLSVCHCLDPKISLREMNDKYPHGGGLIGYVDSYLNSVLRYSIVFRIYAILHDFAGVVYTKKSKGPDYCYMIGGGPNSCLFAHITGLLFCLYLKFLVPSIFNRFN